MTDMSPNELTLWASLTIGLLFGAVGQVSGFCLQRGLYQRWSGRPGNQLQSFAWALAVAVVGTQAVAAMGLVDLGQSVYLSSRMSWAVLPLGGVIFGYGMGMANSCGARALVLLGQGNLRSLVVLMCLGIGAYVTLSGLLAPLRAASASATPAALPAAGVPPGASALGIAAGLAAVLLLFGLRGAHGSGRARELIGGAIVGLLVVAGWLATGWLGYDEFEQGTVASLSFVAPIGESLLYAMISTGMELKAGTAVVAGVFGGSLLLAVIRRKFCWEGFQSTQQLGRCMAGGVLMGIGGVMAMGCSIGQGLSGISTLSYGSLIALAAIVVGNRLAYRHFANPAPMNAIQNTICHTSGHTG